MTKYLSGLDCCASLSALPSSPQIIPQGVRESRQEEQQAESLLEQGGSMRAAVSPAETSPALLGQPGMPCGPASGEG